MSHEHNFSRNATSIRWNEENEEIVVSRDCEGFVHSGTQLQIPSGEPSFQEEPCPARKEQAYRVRSVVDTHDHHDEPENHSITVLDGVEATKHSVHKDSLSEVPDWIDEAVERARSKARDVEAKFFMCYLGGPEISMILATSDTEYTIVMTRVDERVVEGS